MTDAAPPQIAYETRPLELADGTLRTVLELGDPDGVPMLLIHGMSGTHRHWGRAFLEGLLLAGRRLICINHIGVAGSTRATAPFTIVDLAEAQIQALDALEVAGAIDVFGISMGGMTAQELVLRYPERVRSLVLGCTTAGSSLATWTAEADMRRLVEAMQSGDAARALRASWEINVSDAFAAQAAAYDEFVASTKAERVSLRVITEQMQAIIGQDTVERLAGITVPTTVAHGTEDRLLPYPNGVAIHEAIPGSVLETFEGAGHLFFWEDPQRAVKVALETSSRAG